MRKIIFTVLLLTLFLVGCTQKNVPVAVEETYTTQLSTYYKMSDGTWLCDGNSYLYRLEISGQMHNAAKESTFVYLSNLETISFDRAWKASGLSSNIADYFSPEEAVLIEWK